MPHHNDLLDGRSDRVVRTIVTGERRGFSGAAVVWIWHEGGDHPQASRASG